MCLFLLGWPTAKRLASQVRSSVEVLREKRPVYRCRSSSFAGHCLRRAAETSSFGNAVQGLVTNIWHNVINAEVKKLANADAETKLATLGSKMKTLGRTYALSEQFFSLEFLVKTLETLSIKWNGSPGKCHLFKTWI